MALPYQCLIALGHDGILCTSRGSSIYTFGADGSLISSWQHPTATKQAKEDAASAENGAHTAEDVDEESTSSPAPKRRKLTSGQVSEEKAPASENPEPDNGAPRIGGQKKKKGKLNRLATAQDQPFVILLRETPDGTHVIAVTGQDKSVWVFEHDGKGQLKELSQRTMHKRPCDVVITPDSKTILVADKFGDVYSVPRIAPPIPTDGATTIDASAPEQQPTITTTSRLPESKGANPLTVHSQRNLKSLEDQRIQREKAAMNGGAVQPKLKPEHEHELLLGHVSMLTSVALAASPDGKRAYILTADRDEHIRVSRGAPHAHVIEGYCLGHGSFVSALCLPRPEVLVSGGGDNELYVWDWVVGTLKSKVELLRHVKEVVPDAGKIAVSGLYHHGRVEALRDLVLVICERVPAVFTFTVSDTLELVQTVKLPGNPLDLTAYQIPGKPTRLVVATDVDGAAQPTTSSLVGFDFIEGGWDSSTDLTFQEPDAAGLDMPRSELDKILYNVETLRKTDFDDAPEVEPSTAMEAEKGAAPFLVL